MKRILICMAIAMPGLTIAQTGQTQLKVEAGAILTHKFTMEVEKHFPGKLALWCRFGIIDPTVFPEGQLKSEFRPALQGILLKAGPKIYLTERFAIRPEIGYSRYEIPDPPAPVTRVIEFTQGYGLSVSYTLPLKYRIILEPFAGVTLYRISLTLQIPSDGFTNDFTTTNLRIAKPDWYSTPTHLSINGTWGVTGGLNIGLAFPTE